MFMLHIVTEEKEKKNLPFATYEEAQDAFNKMVREDMADHQEPCEINNTGEKYTRFSHESQKWHIMEIQEVDENMENMDTLYFELEKLKKLKEACEKQGIELRDLLLSRLIDEMEDFKGGICYQSEELKNAIDYYIQKNE